MIKHIHIKISGKVQGVGFRFSAYEKFVEFGLIGRADNNLDWSVSIEAEGPEEKLDEFLDWCKRGPTDAKVENVQTTEMNEPFVPLKMG